VRDYTEYGCGWKRRNRKRRIEGLDEPREPLANLKGMGPETKFLKA